MKKIFTLIVCSIFLFSFTIDKKYPYDDNAFWAAHYNIPRYMAVVLTSIALIEGSNTRLGKTAFVSLDSVLINGAITQSLKYATGRVRPRNAENSSEWFKSGNMSFPSGHVSSVTSFVTPFILEYYESHPWVWTLAFLPVHQMVGRVKYQAHWTSDVIAGAMVGVLSGYLAYNNKPIFLSLSGDKTFVGLRYRF